MKLDPLNKLLLVICAVMFFIGVPASIIYREIKYHQNWDACVADGKKPYECTILLQSTR